MRCTVYPDIVVRETGVDGPTPGKASLLKSKAPCSSRDLVEGRVLDTEFFSFFGRKDGFLIFQATDPHGAVPFKIVDTSGRTLYSDGLIDKFSLVEIEHGLHLRFTRGVNLPCSILKDAACWTKTGNNGLLPRVLTTGKPPVAACTLSYSKDKVLADNPNIITYDVDMSIPSDGKPLVNSRGTIGCEPMP